jgi:hypothetical protein
MENCTKWKGNSENSEKRLTENLPKQSKNSYSKPNRQVVNPTGNFHQKIKYNELSNSATF